MKPWAILGLLLSGFLFPWTAAAANGDEETGAKIATTWCSACHAVGPANAGTDAAPAFDHLAQERTIKNLRAFLTEPHGRMPNIQLSRQQIEDVIVFIKARRR